MLLLASTGELVGKHEPKQLLKAALCHGLNTLGLLALLQSTKAPIVLVETLPWDGAIGFPNIYLTE